mmetsp:Transcript_12850/g.47556  ORF Transcript_12850/g.47556 Transcript_12850/m.47556 type:complete len:372 (-) Transcript_12850:472-1587(-)
MLSAMLVSGSRHQANPVWSLQSWTLSCAPVTTLAPSRCHCSNYASSCSALVDKILDSERGHKLLPHPFTPWNFRASLNPESLCGKAPMFCLLDPRNAIASSLAKGRTRLFPGAALLSMIAYTNAQQAYDLGQERNQGMDVLLDCLRTSRKRGDEGAPPRAHDWTRHDGKRGMLQTLQKESHRNSRRLALQACFHRFWGVIPRSKAGPSASEQEVRYATIRHLLDFRLNLVGLVGNDVRLDNDILAANFCQGSCHRRSALVVVGAGGGSVARDQEGDLDVKVGEGNCIEGGKHRRPLRLGGSRETLRWRLAAFAIRPMVGFPRHWRLRRGLRDHASCRQVVKTLAEHASLQRRRGKLSGHEDPSTLPRLHHP